MFPIQRALMPVLALSGVLLSLAPVAQAGPPPWAAAYENGHSSYGSRRDYGDRREEHGRRDERRGDYREYRAPRTYYYERGNDPWRYGNDYRHDYRYDHRDYQYQGYRGNSGYGGYGGYGRYSGGGRNDYPVGRSGRCGTDGVLAVAGAVTGGIIGNHSAARGNRDAATVFGAIAGGILGNAIGRSIDDGNRACGGDWRPR